MPQEPVALDARKWPEDLAESGKLVERILKRLDWSQDGLAQHLGYSRETIGRWRRSERLPDKRAQKQLMELLRDEKQM